MSEILLDDRTGSGDLCTYLQRWGVPHELTRLDYGDAACQGTGPVEAVGIEIKRVRDALQCMRDGRFAGHQLPGLLKEYGAVWLVVEGAYGVDVKTGQLTNGAYYKPKPLTLGRTGPGFQYKELDHWLTTLEVRAGIHIRHTNGRIETARFLADMAGWWEKSWEKHRSHLAIHTVQPDAALLLGPASVFRKVAAQLPGIGFVRSAEVERHFGTIADMCRAGVEEWQKIDGIGPKFAQMVVDAIRGVK